MISGLALVSVTAQHGDNQHRIFESLNNTGLTLTQADLLRNYLFMRLPTRGAAAYESLWLPLSRTSTARPTRRWSIHWETSRSPATTRPLATTPSQSSGISSQAAA